jgi:hypothetical protein
MWGVAKPSSPTFGALIEQDLFKSKSATELVLLAKDPNYWADLAVEQGWLTQGGSWTDLGLPKPGDSPPLRDAISKHGYFRAEGILDRQNMAALCDLAEGVRDRGWPRVFALLFPLFWEALQAPSLLGLLEGIFGPGFVQLPGMWIHHVPSLAGSRGWEPHLDVNQPSQTCDNGGPDRLSIWLALTDATLDNGCMFAVSKKRVPESRRFHGRQDFPAAEVIELLHAATPLPVGAGGILGWSYDTLHWGGIANGEGGMPRLALSLEFMNGEATRKKEERPLLAAGSIPDFSQRLFLVGRNLRAYAGDARRERHAHQFFFLGEALAPGA